MSSGLAIYSTNQSFVYCILVICDAIYKKMLMFGIDPFSFSIGFGEAFHEGVDNAVTH